MPLPAQLPAQNPYGPLINFQTTNVLPPSAIYLGPNDGIFVQCLIPTLAAVAVTVSYRILKPDGTIATTVDRFNFSNSPSFNNTVLIPPQEGFLLSFTVVSGNASRGQVFTRVFLNSGGGTVGGPLAHLFCQGYTSLFDFIAFPQSPLAGSLDGRGWLHDIVAGSNFSAPIVSTVPANVHWLLRSISYTFTAGAAAGNRVPFVTVRDAAGIQLALQLGQVTIPALGSTIMFAAAGQTLANLQGVQSVGLVKDIVLTPGFTVEGNALALNVGDQCGPMNFTVEEFVGQ